ncbi:guanine nucleotide exchange protein for ADP-robosylation factor [Clydaea vesicula]|uniref:Guanine nucleotide exchange protein for ADP-robosylation factor n=1 Tax=Clydaea vesicula TaxID=447962 RepID=A0AAD5TZY6_9FUNG|nr:guanine nucleotide exchange protein for ADP-robosylation factor [Clydaea vesicula]
MQRSPSSSLDSRRPSTLSSISQNNGSSEVFIKLALEQLQNQKDAKKLTKLKDSCKIAMSTLEVITKNNSDVQMDSQTMDKIFLPFQTACQSRQSTLTSIAIDCLGKLFAYNFWGKHEFDIEVFNDDEDNEEKASNKNKKSAEQGRESGENDNGSASNGGIMSVVIDTICDSFAGGENTDEKVQMQIVKALLASVSSSDPASAVHGGVLLKAIRTTYNIFLLSKSANTQIIAQATLTQMVQAVYGRLPKETSIPPKIETKSQLKNLEEDDNSPERASLSNDSTHKNESPASTNNSVTSPVDSEKFHDDETASNASGMRRNGSGDSIASSVALDENSHVKPNIEILNSASIKKSKDSTNDLHIKDAYLVFRALCKLSMKPIPAPEGATDLKSHSMRSKLLSLHLINTILSVHQSIFWTHSSILFSSNYHQNTKPYFIHAVKQYLCLSLSRNAASVVPQVFDTAMEIFGKVLVNLRKELKKELSVIFTEIIIPIIEARSTITFHQRSSVLKVLHKILSDSANEGGKILVEIYLNYDCDVEAGARENIWERLISALSKVNTTLYSMEATHTLVSTQASSGTVGAVPAITTATLTSFTKEQVKELYSSSGDYSDLKKKGLEVLVKGVLGPLVKWCNQRMEEKQSSQNSSRTSVDSKDENKKEEGDDGKSLGLISNSTEEDLSKKTVTKHVADDPMAFENMKHRKQVLIEGIKRFNFKPKKGLQFLLDSSCIPARTPRDIAKFLLNNDGLNKTMIGEFLGEGEEENIAIMHAFVDELDFINQPFVTALRTFLQSFRLPGEAQKIDRFMLKFAERYVKGNPDSFNSADTAYVLSYSVIMLNTDLYNPQVKKRMTKAEFLRNNRGIDEGKDIDPKMLESIFDEIATNEIVLKDEQLAKYDDKFEDGKDNIDVGRYRTKKEIAQIAIANETMALKTEAMFNTIRTKSSSTKKVTKNDQEEEAVSSFYSASHYEHVKSMFQIIWMSVLTGISTPLQETDDIAVIWLSLEGFKLACRICCLFDMDLERKAFITTFSKFTYLTSLNEMKSKNLESIKVLLEIAYMEGNSLGESWREVVLCISQLEKLQLVGSDGELELQRVQRTSSDQQKNSRSSTTSVNNLNPESSSQSLAIAVDRIFTTSIKLTGKAIVDFVRALCIVSWDEISSPAGDTLHPRMNSLQRLIEISYYNMKRIRVEWSQIWSILGEHFNQVGCHPNSIVTFFALDKMRQLSMKFLEIEELPNFKFQKDFLKPFEYILGNNPDPKIKDMVLACLQQMTQAKAKSMKSGWKTLFSAFSKAAKESHESIVLLSFDIVKLIFKSNFENVVNNLTFPDFISCLVEFCKNRRFTKTSLQSIEMIRQSVTKLTEIQKLNDLNNSNTATLPVNKNLGSLRRISIEILKSQESLIHQASPVTPLIPASYVNVNLQPNSGIQKISTDEDPNIKFWFPTLFGLYEIIMTCDLEVRTRALTYLFDSLKTHGSNFSRDFWEVISKGVLFPIFDDLKLSRQEHTKFANKEDMSVWLSTTLIQALRQFIDLFGYYFETLSFLVDGVLELLAVCMTQENETLARIGSTCLHQFIEDNVLKLNEEVWEKICNMFVNLFKVTTPHALFLDSKSNPEYIENASESEIENRKIPEKKDFHSIIVKCVLHLLVIQTLHEVLALGKNEEVYRSLSSPHLFLLIDCLERSYRFASSFNNDMELRNKLFKLGYMKQLPNLLKQETTSVTSYIAILIKMYSDTNEERRGSRNDIAKRLIPLSFDILCHYNSLEPETKQRNVTAWRPVVVTILNALVDFDDEQFKINMPIFYEQVINLLLQEVNSEIRLVMHSLLSRTGIKFNVYSPSNLNKSGEINKEKKLTSYSELVEQSNSTKEADTTDNLDG